jgi:hypothetical protein
MIICSPVATLLTQRNERRVPSSLRPLNREKNNRNQRTPWLERIGY